MPKISLPQLNQTLEIPKGKNLMLALLESGVPVASSCGGDGICGKCKVQITQGLTTLPRPTVYEEQMTAKKRLEEDERLACQVLVSEDLEIRTSYW